MNLIRHEFRRDERLISALLIITGAINLFFMMIIGQPKSVLELFGTTLLVFRSVGVPFILAGSTFRLPAMRGNNPCFLSLPVRRGRLLAAKLLDVLVGSVLVWLFAFFFVILLLGIFPRFQKPGMYFLGFLVLMGALVGFVFITNRGVSPHPITTLYIIFPSWEVQRPASWRC